MRHRQCLPVRAPHSVSLRVCRPAWAECLLLAPSDNGAPPAAAVAAQAAPPLLLPVAPEPRRRHEWTSEVRACHCPCADARAHSVHVVVPLQEYEALIKARLIVGGTRWAAMRGVHAALSDLSPEQLKDATRNLLRWARAPLQTVPAKAQSVVSKYEAVLREWQA